MCLGSIQKELIARLKFLEFEEEAVVGILLMIDTEEKAEELIEWIVDNIETIDKQRILLKAACLSGEMGCSG